MKNRFRLYLADQNRTFAAVMGAMCWAAACVIYVKAGEPPWWAIGTGAAFVLIGLLMPSWLGPLRKFWMKIAAMLGAVNSRIILTAVFAGLVTPVAVILRLLGKRPIQEAAEGGRESYWHRRDQAESRPERMERQF